MPHVSKRTKTTRNKLIIIHLNKQQCLLQKKQLRKYSPTATFLPVFKCTYFNFSRSVFLSILRISAALVLLLFVAAKTFKI